MKQLKEIGQNEWTIEQNDPDELSTRIKVLTANDPEYDEGYIKEKDMLIGFLDEEGVILSVEEQILLRDLLNKLHGREISAQKDY